MIKTFGTCPLYILNQNPIELNPESTLFHPYLLKILYEAKVFIRAPLELSARIFSRFHEGYSQARRISSKADAWKPDSKRSSQIILAVSLERIGVEGLLKIPMEDLLELNKLFNTLVKTSSSSIS